MKIFTQDEYNDLPKNIPLNVVVSKEDGEIVNVKDYRHSVIWKSSGRSLITYCNYCGGSLTIPGFIAVRNGCEIEKKRCSVCADCDSFLGFEGDELR